MQNTVQTPLNLLLFDMTHVYNRNKTSFQRYYYTSITWTFFTKYKQASFLPGCTVLSMSCVISSVLICKFTYNSEIVNQVCYRLLILWSNVRLNQIVCSSSSACLIILHCKASVLIRLLSESSLCNNGQKHVSKPSGNSNCCMQRNY